MKILSNPKVSIIVPVYNVEKYLECCIESLLQQTLKDIEIILVDDESPDHCPSMCDEYAKKDRRVRVIHKKNEGLGLARNSGMEIATGNYITFVDSDDSVALNTYQKLYDLAINSNADVIYFDRQIFDNFGNTWIKSNRTKEKQYHTEEEIRGLMLDIISNPPNQKLDNDIGCSSCCAFFRHDMIKMHGFRFKSERVFISEDRLFNLEYLLHASSVIFIPDTLYNNRVNPSSLTRTVRPDRIEKINFYYQYLLEMLEKINFGLEGYLRATRLFIADSRVAIRQYIQSPLSKEEKIQWLKEVVNFPVWREIASSYPYQQLPLKYAIHFFLLYKRFYRLLYLYSNLKYKSKELQKA